jgi:hypothetical protein
MNEVSILYPNEWQRFSVSTIHHFEAKCSNAKAKLRLLLFIVQYKPSREKCLAYLCHYRLVFRSRLKRYISTDIDIIFANTYYMFGRRTQLPTRDTLGIHRNFDWSQSQHQERPDLVGVMVT